MEKILQIGEGNFLRAFAEYYIQLMKDNGFDDMSVAVCQPRKNTEIINLLKEQNCKYHICLKGKFNGEIVNDVKEISCVSRCIDAVGEYDCLRELFKSDSLEIVISNTTEAGITYDKNDKIENVPNVSFPAKVTALLYERFNAGKKGLIFLPVELIEKNGERLKSIVLQYAELWNLEKEFSKYIDIQCEFCNTLVDRIVTGHIDFQNDNCAVACEPYGSWLIQGSEKVQKAFPISSISSDIQFVSDLSQYRNRKVRVLNGAHTMSVLAGYMSGFDIVRDMVNDEIFATYIRQGLEEVKATLNFDKSEIDSYADSVLERFANPFIDHKLLDISLNSISKFKSRCLPTIKDYISLTGKCPKILTFSLSALIAFYIRKGSSRDYQLKDDESNLSFFNSLKEMNLGDIVNKTLSKQILWDEDLTLLPNFVEKVLEYLKIIADKGINSAVSELIEVTDE